jgi:hypothetical protein
MKRRPFVDPMQGELLTDHVDRTQHPFRLQAGDVIQYDGKLCRVLRVNDCAAVLVMNRPMRRFVTRFDRPVCFQPRPALFRLSPNAEVPILNRMKHRGDCVSETVSESSDRVTSDCGGFGRIVFESSAKTHIVSSLNQVNLFNPDHRLQSHR